MKNKTLNRLFRITGKKKLYILVLMILRAAIEGASVFYALLLRNIVDGAQEHDTEAFIRGIVYITVLVTARIAVTSVMNILKEFTRADLENLFKDRLMNNILRRDYASVSAVHSGEWLNRLTNDTVVTADNCVEILPGLFGTAVKLIGALAMITALDKRFAALVLPAGAVMLLFTALLRKRLKTLHKDIQEKDGRLRIFMQERIGSLMMIKTFAAEQQTSADTAVKMSAHKAARMKRLHFSNFCNTCFSAGINGMYLLGICWCGYGILKGTVTFGTLTAMSHLIALIQTPFANFTAYLPMFFAMLASAERLLEIENFAEEEEEPLSLRETLDLYHNKFYSFGLKDACFRYYAVTNKPGQLSKEDMPAVLQDFSIEIKRGEYAAFKGHSGCGKSTLMKLLMCVYRLDSGERFIKLSDGSTVPLGTELRRFFAYVPQGNQLMSGTIREIVAFSDRSRINDDEQIMQALKIACADEFVSGLENGIDTLLGERGAGLSEGQMQRIAIARAVFSGSPILILDESTSALDEDSERRLLQNLRAMTDKTVLIITHRPAALSICDRVITFP